MLRQLEQLRELAVPRGQLELIVKHGDAVRDVIEGHAKFGAAPLKLGGSFLHGPLQARRCFLPLLQELIERDGIASEYVDGPCHVGDLIVAARGYNYVTATADDRAHTIG